MKKTQKLLPSMKPSKKPLDTAEKVSLGFFSLCLSGFFTLTLANSQNWISEEFVTPAFQFLMAVGGYAVFGKTANVFAESRRDRYRNELNEKD